MEVPVRVMQLVQSLARGGAERLTLELSLGLREAGHETLVVTFIDENAHDEPEYASVDVALPGYSGRRFRWPWYLPRAVSRLGVVRDGSPISYLPIRRTSQSWQRWHPRSPRCPGFPQLLGGGGRDSGTGVAPWDASRSGHSVVSGAGASSSPGRWSKTLCVPWVSPERIRCVPNGIRLEKFPFTSRAAPAAHPHIGTVGSLTEFKRPDLAIRAFALLKIGMPGARLSIVGEGMLRPELERLRGELGLTRDVELPGVCSDVPVRLASWDLYWQMSRFEGLSLAVVEAMASGVPVVVSDVPGLREMMAGGEAGLLIPSGDVRGFAERSVELLASPPRYNGIAAAARAYVERHHDFRRTVEGYIRVAEDAIAGRW